MINADYEQKGLTNSVIKEKKYENCKQLQYYIPGYLRLKVKNFTEMNLQSLDAKMNATMIFTVYYGDLEEDIVDKLLDGIVFLFNRDDALQLKQSLEVTRKHNKGQKNFTYTVRKLLTMRVQSDIFWSPFQIIDLILSITVQPVTVESRGTKFRININLMDYHESFLKLSYSEEGTFGNYDLAQARLLAQYSNDRVPKNLKKSIQNKNPGKAKSLAKQYNQLDSPLKKQHSENKQIQQAVFKKALPKIKVYQYAHFTVPIYKYPIVTIATIFLPLWLLGVINLGIFYQNNVLADRIASIAALMIAFVALIPTIRQQIPPSPNITCVEILVYIETFTSFLCLIHSLLVRNFPDQNTQLQMQYFALFIISAVITAINIVIVIVLFIVHKFIWQPSYNRNLEEQKDPKFKFEQWYNESCDKHFKFFLKDNDKFEVLRAQNPKNKKKQMKEQS